MFFMSKGKEVIQCGKNDIAVFSESGWTLITDPDRIAELTAEHELAQAALIKKKAEPEKAEPKPSKKSAPKKKGK